MSPVMSLFSTRIQIMLIKPLQIYPTRPQNLFQKQSQIFVDNRLVSELGKIMGKPMVWINEIPWHEMGSEVQLRTSTEFCRTQERWLRHTLY